MSPIPTAIEDHVSRNWEVYTAGISALSIAAVCTMPKKCPLLSEDNRFQEVWTWIRDSLQTAVPAARAQHQNPQQPGGPAQEGK